MLAGRLTSVMNMVMYQLMFCAWLLLSVRVASLALSLPEATQHISSADATFGWTPAPTEPPEQNLGPLIHQAELRKRQRNTNTCGYFYGNPTLPYICSSSLSCYTSGSLYACCSPGVPCQVYSGCYDSTQAALCVGFCTQTALVW